MPPLCAPPPLPLLRVHAPQARAFAPRCRWSIARAAIALVLALAPLLWPAATYAQPRGDDAIRAARDAYTKQERTRIGLLRAQVMAEDHPLAGWVDYWDLNLRLAEATTDDLRAFYERRAGSYVEDRMRNDWLLELGRRRDWTAFRQDYPRFRMNDDREVTCYALLTEHLQGKDVRELALRNWLAQRDGADGCQLLAQTLYDAQLFTDYDVWRKLRYSIDSGREKAARTAAPMLGPVVATAVNDILDNAPRFLTRKAPGIVGPARAPLTTLAIARIATSDPDAAARQLTDLQDTLGHEHAAWAWSAVARQSAMSLLPTAYDQSRTAWERHGRRTPATRPDWSDETLGWMARSALRLARGGERWQFVRHCIDAMSPTERDEAVWVYWRARAELALAGPEPAKEPRADRPSTEQQADQARDTQQNIARTSLASLSGQLSFYGQLAAEELGAPQLLPPKPAALTPAEREAARNHPGLKRALMLLDLSLRSEGNREWNYSLIGMNDRELLAAAQLACDREIWDRCINTSDRTRTEIDLEQRYPTPLRQAVLAKAREIGIDAAYVYGLIRQESRFIVDARSHVGASGLMQVMPATARWTAKKIGMPFKPEMITERDTNLTIGTSYLKLVLDDFEGSQAMAAAAYNAGPGRPRRWRNGPMLEPAIWAENVPFNETRDYVKKVLSNATLYAGLLNGGKPASLKARLGPSIGPRDAAVPSNLDLP